jgi:hypothetical protein
MLATILTSDIVGHWLRYQVCFVTYDVIPDLDYDITGMNP